MGLSEILKKVTDLQKEINEILLEQEKEDFPEQKSNFLQGPALLLRQECENYLKEIEKGNEPEKQYVFERAMELVYGDAVWNWINKEI